MKDTASSNSEQSKEVKAHYRRALSAKIFSLLGIIFYIMLALCIALLFDEGFYNKVNSIVEDRYYILFAAISSFSFFIIFMIASYGLNNKNKIEKSVGNPYDFIPSEEQEYLFKCINYVLSKIADCKKINEEKRKELSNAGQSYLALGIGLHLMCIIIFQIFSYISPEKELFKIYGMISCTLACIIIDCIGIWHFNQSKKYINRLSVIMNAELHIVKCVLILNLNISKNEKNELLRSELLNSDIEKESRHVADNKEFSLADTPYKMFFDVLRDMAKKE